MPSHDPRLVAGLPLLLQVRAVRDLLVGDLELGAELLDIATIAVAVLTAM